MMLLSYILINLFFACIYFIIGIEGISGVHLNDWFEGFMDSFFFSSQTLTTVGYGAMSPANKSIGLIAAFESFIGLLGFALATGLLYGRFSKPKV